MKKYSPRDSYSGSLPGSCQKLSSPGWFDTHCHFDFPAFNPDRRAVWQHCETLGISGLIVPGVCREQGERLASFCAGQPWFFALGLHPCFSERHRMADLDWLEQVLSTSECVAVGEFGLHFSRPVDLAVRQQQRQLFDAQIQLAQQYKLPVILHGVGAHDEIIQALRLARFDGGGVVHAFSGSEQQARQYLDLGFCLGLGGLLLRPNAHRLRRTVQQLPLEAWLLETDAPDMTPAIAASRRNSPVFLPLVGVALARIKQLTPAALQACQADSIRKLFFPLSDHPI
ncbi:TatD family hydrolase [Candidatus Thalassolituus haligoni]|uniref:TatD family hydrolase n=1 Tax=Candidatus Thalassolituus haligoni TaxID=3100113 RepID=UPI0035118FC1|tara:strand:- start:4159 stop:5013 length:855 start_codon:yes stop_codon:yes gene_type:complete